MRNLATSRRYLRQFFIPFLFPFEQAFNCSDNGLQVGSQYEASLVKPSSIVFAGKRKVTRPAFSYEMKIRVVSSSSMRALFNFIDENIGQHSGTPFTYDPSFEQAIA